MVAERDRLRLAGLLMLGGMILLQVVTVFHPSTEDPNDHPAVFAEYARSDAWRAVHFGQFLAGLIVIAGFVVLFAAVRGADGRSTLVARLGFAAAVATGAAVSILQAIDGVALKQAVDAWASAPLGGRPSAFRDAETVRWAEWGVNSYFRLLQGMSLILLGVVLARSTPFPKWLGSLACLAGIGYIAVGIIVGYEGFSDAAIHIVGPPADVLFFTVAIGITVFAWRLRPDADSAPARSEGPSAQGIARG